MSDSYNGGGLTPEQVAELDNAAAEALDMKIKNCGDLVRKLKTEKASKDKIKEEVNVLLLLKGAYKKKTGEEWKPGNTPPAEPKQEKKGNVKVEEVSYIGGGLTAEQVAELDNAAAEALDMKIKNCGDLIRKLKTEKASKEQIGEEVKVLLTLKTAYKKKTGQEWKPSNAPPAEPKKREKRTCQK